ncbi:MAG: hypothetical protein OXH09_20470 [Gammaproteobacteria bacterium]|nr:hypothetical protein [Gammaproteobacteria bacterium]
MNVNAHGAQMAQLKFHPPIRMLPRRAGQQAVVTGELGKFSAELWAISRVAAAYRPTAQSVVDGVDSVDPTGPPTKQIPKELVNPFRGVLGPQCFLGCEP